MVEVGIVSDVEADVESARARTSVEAEQRPRPVGAGAQPAAPQPNLVARWIPWVRDATWLAYVLSGGLLFDPRLAIAAHVSLNQILGGAALGFVALRLCTGERIHLREAHTLLLVAVLTGLLAVRAIGSLNPTYAQFKVAGYAAMVLPLILYLDLFVRTPADVGRWLRISSLAALALVALGIPHMLAIEGGQRLAVLGGGPNTLARHIGTGSIAALVLLALHRNRVHVLITVAGLALCGLALLLTGTKAVMLSLALTSVFVLTRLGRRRELAIVLLGMVLLALLPFVTHDLVRDQPKDGGLVRLLRLPDVDDPLGSYGSRLRFVSSTWRELLANPWLGAGTGGWGRNLGLGWDQAYPHNIGLEVLGETGLVGLVLLGCVAARWIRSTRRVSKASGSRQRQAMAHATARVMTVGIESLVVFWSVNVMLSGDLVDSRYFWMWLCVWELYRRRMCPCPSQA